MFGDFPYILCIHDSNGDKIYRRAYLEGDRERRWQERWNTKDYAAMRREAESFGQIISAEEARRVFIMKDGFTLFVVPQEAA